MKEIIYHPCKYCGKSHGMGIENMLTGEIKPIDICGECLWKPLEFNEPKEQITLNDIH